MNSTDSYKGAQDIAPTDAPAVAVHDLTHDFGQTRSLDGVTFNVRSGEIFGLLGPNGAGKTTAIKILLGLLRPSGGGALVAGLDVTVASPLIRRTVGWVPQGRAVDPLLTARENLHFAAGLYHFEQSASHQRAAALLALVGLEADADRVVGDFSGGMRRRLELAVGLVHLPTVLFLDEPTLGLDISARRQLWDHIDAVRKQGTTIVMTTHYLDEADALCDRVAIIQQGQVRGIGAPEELKLEHGTSSVCLRLEQPSSELYDRLSAHRWVSDVNDNSTTLTVKGSCVVGTVEAVLDACRAVGVVPQDLWTVRPSLEDVFLSLTGQPLYTNGPNGQVVP